MPADHPLRPIKQHHEAVVRKLSPLFEELYAEHGRPGIPPEQRLKARVLTAFYTVRSDTHQSTTDPESVLYRKAQGKEAKLCFGGHSLRENRNGLCADFTLHNPITEPAPVMARRPIHAHQKRHAGVQVKTMGADKA